MPKEQTHWILAERALTGLSGVSTLAANIRTHRELYLAGAVLPDTLLHVFRGAYATQALSHAHAFHDTASNSYTPLIRTEEHHSGTLPPALLACLLGVLSHMQADIVFHPYVYATAGLADIGRHYHLETAIDIHFLQQRLVPRVQRLNELVTTRTRDTLLSACALLFDPDGTLPRHILEHALNLHCRFQAMYGNTFWKIAAKLFCRLPVSPVRHHQHLFYPLFPSKIDAVSRVESTWRHPVTRDLQHTSIDDLAEEAVRRTVTLFTKIEEKGGLTTVLESQPGENLLTGLVGVKQGSG